MRAIRSRLRRSIGSLSPRDMFDTRQRVYFLHIGKTAGTQIAGLTDQINAKNLRWRVVPCKHGRKLLALPGDAPYFFSIRRPETRFRSAFYSRKRKGQPRNNIEWSPDEAITFARFEHANDLAEALFQDGEDGRQAFFAMKSISHTSMNQIDWFDRSGHFLERRPPVWIVRQEAFDPDLTKLLHRLDHDEPVQVANDPFAAHANDYEGIPDLSEKALSNLRIWYAQDYAFYRFCCDWIEANA